MYIYIYICNHISIPLRPNTRSQRKVKPPQPAQFRRGTGAFRAMGANSRGETPVGAGHGGHGGHGAWPGHGVMISDGRNMEKNTSLAFYSNLCRRDV